MDLLERARAIAACSLFAELAPAVVVRLAERAAVAALAPGDRRTTAAHAWLVAAGALAVAADGAAVGPGHALGVIRLVAPATPVLEVVATAPSTLLALALDDLRDVLDEDPAALAALTAALARALLATDEAPAP